MKIQRTDDSEDESVVNKKMGNLVKNILILAAALSCFAPVLQVSAEKSETLRVGFFAFDGYHILDENGDRSGYGYELLQMMKRYEHWDYEYAGYDKSWAQMQEMLENGELDLMSSAQKTEERLEKFDFSERPVGSSSTILTVKAGDSRFIAGDYSTYEGARIGMLENSSRNESFAAFAGEKGFTYRPVYYPGTDDLTAALDRNEIDGIVTSDLRSVGEEWILEKFDTSDYYVIVKKGNKKLLDQVNEALELMDRTMPGWRTELQAKYYSGSNTGEILLNTKEREYLKQTAVSRRLFRVIMNPDREPYTWFENGQPSGIMPDIFAQAAKKLGIEYEIVETKDREAYHAMLSSGTVDIWLDADFDFSLAEDMGFVLTQPYLSTGFSTVTLKDFSGDIKSVATVKKSETVSRFARNLYGADSVQYYDSLQECVQAVKERKVDATVLYTYSAQRVARQDIRNRLVSSVIPESSASYAIGVNALEDRCLLTLLNKAMRSLSGDTIENAIWENTELFPTTYSFIRLIYDYPFLGMLIILILSAILILIILVHIREKNNKRVLAEQEKSRKALMDALEKAQKASAAKQDFLSKMSHDIRTPMNAVLGMTELAQLHLNDRERIRTYLEKIQISGKHLLALINEVLDMNKIDSGKLELADCAFSLEDMMQEVVSMTQSMFQAKSQAMTFRVKNIVHEYVIGDVNRIEQIILNLISNAVKYTDVNGKIEIGIDEEVRTEEESVYSFYVKDNGIGISEEFRAHIFEEFSREEDSRISSVEGTGLGMAIVKRFTDMMGGTVAVESTLGKGSKFTVRLPLKHQRRTEQYADFSDMRILVVDDYEECCQSICHILEQMNIKNYYTLQGSSAVEELKRAHRNGTDYSVVILDWLLKEETGLEVVDAIRKEAGLAVPVIMISAYDFSEIESEAKTAGIQSFIMKPVFMSRLRYELGRLRDGETCSASETPSSRSRSLKGLHVLLAEDNDLNAEIAVEMLKCAGIETDRAVNGEDALRIYKKSPEHYYDIILMDVQMPVMNGYEASSCIRSSGRCDASLPIFALTANAFYDDVEKSKSAGMNEHISKPINMEELIRYIEKWCKGN